MPTWTYLPRAIAWLACLLAAAPALGAEIASDPPRLEEYQAKNRLSEFSAAASTFVEQHPDSPLAADVLTDALSVAIDQRDDYAIRRLKVRLLLDYPQPARVRLMLATFTSGEKYASFLNDCLGDVGELDHPQLAERYCRAIRFGVQHWKGDPLKDDDLLVRAMLLAQSADDKGLLDACRQMSERSKKQAVRAVSLEILEGPRDPVRKILSLHALKDNDHTPWCKSYLLSRLTEPQHQDPRILLIEAEDLLIAENWAEALPKVALLVAKENRPQWQYWQVLCLAALRRDAEAAQALGRFQSTADDPWRAMAARVVEAERGADEASQQFAAALLKVMQTLATDVEQLECWGEISPVDGSPALQIYLGADLKQSELHLAILLDNQMTLASRSVRDESWFILAGKNSIYHFPRRGMLPHGEFSLSRNADGTFGGATQFGVNTNATYEQTIQFYRSVVESPCFTTTAGVRALLERGMQKGEFPVISRVDQSGTRFAWITPGVSRPIMDEIKFQLNPHGRLVLVESGRYRLSKIRYGRSGEFTMQPPDWPQFPQIEKSKVDKDFLTVFMQSLASLASFAQ
ncbi:MAG: hypothetical protein AB7O62_00485 [Pirellulales bacterium]